MCSNILKRSHIAQNIYELNHVSFHLHVKRNMYVVVEKNTDKRKCFPIPVSLWSPSLPFYFLVYKMGLVKICLTYLIELLWRIKLNNIHKNPWNTTKGDANVYCHCCYKTRMPYLLNNLVPAPLRAWRVVHFPLARTWVTSVMSLEKMAKTTDFGVDRMVLFPQTFWESPQLLS